jgi:hypothetical protein
MIAVMQRGKHHPQLHARELLAETLVHAMPEGHVPAGRAEQIEGVGIGEVGGIAVGRGDRNGDRLTGLDPFAVQFDVHAMTLQLNALTVTGAPDAGRSTDP